MSAALPEPVNAWRAVVAQRHHAGSVPLGRLPRLASMLADTVGNVTFALSFGRDVHGLAYLDVAGEAALPLTCQRSLERFLFPVRVAQRLGLVRDEAEEARLPAGCEALLVGADDLVDPLAALEDELILAVPLVPMAPGSEVSPAAAHPNSHVGPASAADDASGRSPFAVLAQLQSKR